MARLELLDVGSSKGKALKANVEQALRELGLDLPIAEVKDIGQLLAYGISGIPALAVDGRVVLQQSAPSTRELKVVLSMLLSGPQASGLHLSTIVAPTDFSETASNALAYAKSMAAVQGAGLNIVHVHPAQVGAANPFVMQPIEDELYIKEQELESFFGRPIHTNGFDSSQVPMRKEIIVGPVIEELRRLSKLPDTDMIVMGATGKSSLLNRLFGSVSSEVARLSSCPVLLVPEGARFRGFRNIVFAGNFEPHEHIVLPRALEFARRFGSMLHYVHISAHPDETYRVHKIPLYPVDAEKQPAADIVTIECSDILEGLNRYASEHRADLIAMSTTRRSFTESLFHRSVTRQAVFQIHTPLLIMHSDD
ncbi:MAG: universal stress protein [Saprospiraceae bacterium]|nr:universal stress protein [Saprospiraceae bacterium]